jgi:hypothetical protein
MLAETGIETTWPTRYVYEVVVVVIVATVRTIVSPETMAALAGATELRTPKPREATATSATRLKVVFVDICFLSISRDRESPALGFE